MTWRIVPILVMPTLVFVGWAWDAVASERTLFAGEDIFQLQAADDPQISPSGRQIAYIRLSNDILSDSARPTLWVIDVATGKQTQIPIAAGAPASPRWSPDESRLAFVTATSDASHLLVRRMTDGNTTEIAPLVDSPTSLSWSPEGDKLAFIMSAEPETRLPLAAPLAKPEGAAWASPLTIIDRIPYRADGQGFLNSRHDQVFVVHPMVGAPRQMTFGPWNAVGPLAWTSHGGAVLFASDRREGAELRPPQTQVYSVDLASGVAGALTHRDGTAFAAQLSQDGSNIAYLGHDETGHNHDNTEIYVMHRDGTGARSLTASLDRSIDAAVWCGNSALCASYVDHGVTRVARLTLDGHTQILATGLVGPALELPMMLGATFSVSTKGRIAFTGGDSWHPPDVYLATDDGHGRRLTDLNAQWLARKVLAPVAEFSVSATDGLPIEGWLVRPAAADPAKRLPLILEIHGGPYQAYGPAFSIAHQLYAAAGYGVLYVNPRGSTSYGAGFTNLIESQFPGKNYDDLMAAVDAAVDRGIADPHRLFVTGASAGGLMTAWIVGKTHRFQAAAAQQPIANWTSWRLTTDNPGQYFPAWLVRKPWDDPQGYWARSPLSLVGQVSTPTLVIAGTEDYIARATEAEQYFVALKLKGVPTNLILVPGAGHNNIASRPSQSAAKTAAIIAWFDRYRGP